MSSILANLKQITSKIRSKNAGPFWITIDIFFDKADSYKKVKKTLSLDFVSKYLNLPLNSIKRFELDSLQVIKISIQRPVIQGSPFDRDLHGAQLANLFSDLEIN